MIKCCDVNASLSASIILCSAGNCRHLYRNYCGTNSLVLELCLAISHAHSKVTPDKPIVICQYNIFSAVHALQCNAHMLWLL